jgi:hypothetical protein
MATPCRIGNGLLAGMGLKGLLCGHYLLRRSVAVEASINGPVSQQELIRLATKLREDLMNYEEKLGSSREFAELMHSAGALIVAITEPEEFRLSVSQSQNARDGSSGTSFPHIAK